MGWVFISRCNLKIKRIKKEEFLKILDSGRCWFHDNYLTMYSSLWKGYITDPELMLIPIDDHLVHRGDGVFDVMRCVNGKIYQLDAHLRRLERSAKGISLDFPDDYKNIKDIIKELIRAGGIRDCIIRVIVSRGPGSFTVNPYDCPESQLYVNVIRFRSPPDRFIKEGVKLISSKVPIKEPFFARIKSCNYLPNVLMKMEALNTGYDFAVSIDGDGCLGEGATENIGVVTKTGVLKLPGFDRTLAGITAGRIYEFSKILKEEKIIDDYCFDSIPLSEAYEAREIFLAGTSITILPVVKFDDRVIGDGKPGSVYKRLSELFYKDMTENQDLLEDVGMEND